MIALWPCRAVRIDAGFRWPENRLSVYVDGYDAQVRRVLRCQYKLDNAKRVRPGPARYVFVAGENANGFRATVADAEQTVCEIEIFARIVPETRAGIILCHVELAPR